MLVNRQDTLSGFWTGVGGAESQPVVGTSFALLFLSKGRWPVLLGKLQHGPDDDWNRHRSDVANLTRYVESRWKRDLTWQVIDLRLATVEDLLQSPVLYLCGSESPLPEQPAEQKELAQKLRGYLDRGGFLLAEGYCGGAGFDRGFRDLMRQVFPEPEYKLQLLEPEHPIWYAEEKIAPRLMRPLWGVEFGCRTSVVYAPLDPPGSPRPSLSCLWELARSGRTEKYSTAVQEQIDAALALGINILAYATNRELKTKEESFQLTTAPRAGDQNERGRLYVATLRHPGRMQRGPAGGHKPDGRRRRPTGRPHPRPRAAAGHYRRRPVRLSSGVHARADLLPADRRRTEAAETVRRTRRDAPGRLDLRQPGLHRIVPPRDGGHLSRP